MKILYVTTIGITMGFFKSLIRELIDEGHTVDIATNENYSNVPGCYREWGCKVFPISTSRFPFSIGNIKATKEIKAIANNYDIVHCHTPLAGMATRFACRSLRKYGIRVIYTAHGFHFYKGSPLKNWLLYYPIEVICSYWTDVLITINKEDYELAKRKMKAKIITYIAGVGVDTRMFSDIVIDKDKKREELGIPRSAKMILSVGELNKNKNHQIVIKALGRLHNSNIHYVIAGIGDEKRKLEILAKEKSVNLHLLGYRKDVAELYKCADLYVHPSLREGLPVALMEAMAAGLPCIASDTRGCRDLILDRGLLFDPNNPKEVLKNIQLVYKNRESNIYKTDMQKFSISYTNVKMKDVYLNDCATKDEDIITL